VDLDRGETKEKEKGRNRRLAVLLNNWAASGEERRRCKLHQWRRLGGCQ